MRSVYLSDNKYFLLSHTILELFLGGMAEKVQEVDIWDAYEYESWSLHIW